MEHSMTESYRPPQQRAQASEQQVHTYGAPLGAATSGELHFVRGATMANISADPQLAELFHAQFEGVDPEVRVEGSVISVRYRRLALLDWARYALLWGRHTTRVRLNTGVAWRLTARGGVSQLAADLRGLQIAGIAITGGASDLQIALGMPRGVVPVRIGGGASQITLLRPPGTSVRLVIRSGATRLSFDAQHYGSVGGSVRLESPGASEDPNRYDVEVHGGASNLAVDAS
jgi:hypothetical protein